MLFLVFLFLQFLIVPLRSDIFGYLVLIFISTYHILIRYSVHILYSPVFRIFYYMYNDFNRNIILYNDVL